MRIKIGLMFVVMVGCVWALRPRPSAALAACVHPELQWSTLLGSDGQEDGNQVAVAADGSVWLAGTTYSTVFITPTLRSANFDAAHGTEHGVDPFMAGLSADGSTLQTLIYANPAGQNQEDEAYSVGLDAAGNRYFAGRTRSPDLCTSLGSGLPGYDTTYDSNSNGDGYVIKVGTDGAIAYCTFIGGNELDVVRSLAVSADGEVTVTGGTWSTVDFPTTTSVAHAGLRDAFVLRLNAAGDGLVFSTLLGGSSQESGFDVDIDNDGNTYVTGWTFSNDLPTSSGAADETANGAADAFAAKVSADGTPHYLTYLGGSSEDRGNGIAVDRLGRAWVVGATSSADFPTTSDAFDTTYNGVGISGHDVFVTRLAADGTALTSSSFVGASAEERAQAVAAVGNDVFVTGYTNSADFPTTADALSQTHGGGSDAFVLQLTPGASTLAYSTLLGGSDVERGNGLVVDANGVVTVSGYSRSADFCTTTGAYSETNSGDYDAFVTRFGGLDAAEMPTLLLPMLNTP